MYKEIETHAIAKKRYYFKKGYTFNHGGAKPNIKWYKKIYHFWLFSLLMI